MKTEVAFCSGCGHQVRLVFTDPPPQSDFHMQWFDQGKLLI